MGAEPPECGAKLMAQEFQCLQCGRKVEEHEVAWFSGKKICTECYYSMASDRRCARCFRKLESWQGKRSSWTGRSTANSASCF